MQVFDAKSGWGSKVNFVDEHNVLVGYDLSQNCCETADWFISEKVESDYEFGSDLNQPRESLGAYVFDAAFHKQFPAPGLDEGEMAVFKLVCDGKPDMFLHLFNCHNGYYSHGFEQKVGDIVVREGYL